MGVSFKISSTGTRFKPKPLIPDSNSRPDNSPGCSRIPSNNESNGKDEDAIGTLGSSLMSRRDNINAEDEVSFILNLYPDRYSIGNPSENDSRLHAAFQEGPKLSLPYDRTSEGLFAAIETGRLPGGILDDIPCKYVKGAIICEIRDYRKCISNSGSNTPSVTGSPTITQVRLHMSLENVVKDIPLIAEDSWTYGDLMEVESRILKALQPKLCLDPTPKLNKLSENPVSIQLNLGLARKRKRSVRQMPEVTVTSSNHLYGKKVCINRAHESSSYRNGELGPSSGDMLSTLVQDNVAVQGIGDQRNIHNPMQGPNLSIPGASPSSQDMSMSYTENINSSVLGKMQSQEGQLSPYLTRNKRTRLVSGCPDGSPQQQISPYMDSLQGPDVQWRNQLLQQPQNVLGIQYGNPGMQKYPMLNGDGIGNQECVKLEKPDSSNLVKSDMQMMETESGHMDPRLQRQIHPQSFMRPAFQQPSWTSLNQRGEKDPRKEERFLKRKSIQSPRLSAGAMAQTPLSAKSADMSCGSMGVQYGAVSSANPLGQLQRDKSAVISFPSAERTASMTSSANDSMQPQRQAQLTANRMSNSFSKKPIMSGVGSPVSVNNMGGPMSASSPSISTPQLTEQSMIERFAKIEVVSMRRQLNCKKNKVEEYPRKPRVFSQQELSVCLSTAANNEYLKDESCTKPMSQSLVGGSMNVCKLRVLNLQPERTPQGNMISMSPTVKMRMIMSEKPNDGTVAIHYGDLEDGDYLNAEDYLPTLPNTHTADLYATQFSALMTKEGFFVDNHIQPRPHRINISPSSGQPSNYVPAVAHNNIASDMQQYSEMQQTADTKPTISPDPNNLHPNSGIGNPQSLQAQMSLKQEPLDLPHQQQHLTNPMMQHQPHFQRSSSMMLPTNSIPQLSAYGQISNLPSGNNNNINNNKPSPQYLQQQQQQAPSHLQRRMMMGLGPAMGLENMGNNMVGLSSLSNVMGIGGPRSGMSAPMGLGPISGMGATNMGQNSLNMSQANAISQHIRAGTLNPQAVIAQRIKMAQSRILGRAQLGMAGGPRQMQPGAADGLSMPSQTLNQRNLSQIQRAMMGQMGVPKFVPGMNVPMTQQQQQQLQQQSQQEATSPLQGVVSQQQMTHQQQMAQRTPMSPPLNTRPMHPEVACPPSPALSTQTLGSVGSITNSSIELQGVNNSNSVT